MKLSFWYSCSLYTVSNNSSCQLEIHVWKNNYSYHYNNNFTWLETVFACRNRSWLYTIAFGLAPRHALRVVTITTKVKNNYLIQYHVCTTSCAAESKLPTCYFCVFIIWGSKKNRCRLCTIPCCGKFQVDPQVWLLHPLAWDLLLSILNNCTFKCMHPGRTCQ